MAGHVVGPDDAEWTSARAAWNLAVDQHPALVVLTAGPQDVAATLGFASERGLRVAPQGTGHGAASLGALDDTILLRTAQLSRVEVDRDGSHRLGGCGRRLGRPRPARCRARAGRATRALRRGAAWPIHARRRARLARPQSRARGERRDRPRRGAGRRPRAEGSTSTASLSSSGRCAVAGDWVRWSRHSSSSSSRSVRPSRATSPGRSSRHPTSSAPTARGRVTCRSS